MRRGQPSRVVDAVGPASLVEEIVRLLVLSVLGVEGGVRRHQPRLAACDVEVDRQQNHARASDRFHHLVAAQPAAHRRLGRLRRPRLGALRAPTGGEAGAAPRRSWTHVELTKHAGLQLAQHNRIADNTWYWEEYGDFLWSPAIALARWLAQESIALEDKTVLELGAGLGLPGVTAATVGARQVLIQDQLEVSLREVTATAARNGVDDRVSTLACAWDDLGRQLPVDFREPQHSSSQHVHEPSEDASARVRRK